MKKNAIICISALLLAALLLSACGATPPAATASPAPTAAPTAAPEPTDMPEPTATPESPEPPAVLPDGGVSVDYATAELLGQYAGYEEFDEFSDPDYQRIVFSAASAVTDIRYVPLAVADGDETVSFTIGEALYTLPELTPERPLVIAWMEAGLLPNRGVAFTDASGAERVFALITSGEDGSVLLMELVAEPDGAYVPYAAE